MDQIGTVIQVGVHASSVSMNFPTQMELTPGMYVTVISGKLAALQIGHKDGQSTNFAGQLDRARATFPLIMYYAVFQHLFLWVVQGGCSIQDETIQKIEQNNSKTKIIEPMYSVEHCHFNL